MSRDTRAYLSIQNAMMGGAKPNSPNPNERWGKRQAMQYLAKNSNVNGISATFVSSGMFKNNVPMAFGFRFGHPQVPEAPLRPFIQPGTFGAPTNIAGFLVTITRSIDAKTGPVVDTVGLAEGEAMPTCELLARQITIAVTVIPVDPSADALPWTIEVTAAPVDSIDCDSLTEINGWVIAQIPNPFISGYRTLVSGIVDDDPLVTAVQLITENPRRKQFSVMNVGTIPVAIGFGPPYQYSLTPGKPFFPSWGTTALGSFPFATLILPPVTGGIYSRYESPIDGFAGEVWAIAKPGLSPAIGVLNVMEGSQSVL